jgi:hypothetical protein
VSASAEPEGVAAGATVTPHGPRSLSTDRMGRRRRLCIGTAKSHGGPCGQQAMTGQNVCWTHGGKSPQALAAATRRMALQRATAQVGDLAPIDAADALETAIARLHAGVLAHAAVAANGAEEAETYRRWLTDLGKLAKDVHAAGLDERRVRVPRRRSPGWAKRSTGRWRTRRR